MWQLPQLPPGIPHGAMGWLLLEEWLCAEKVESCC